jgi:para-aminobenzoate synthetase
LEIWGDSTILDEVEMSASKPLILFIDAYDSFSNNIVSLLETTLDAYVRTIKIDDPALSSELALQEELSHYAAVVCGPGPGHPGNEKDVGIIRRMWRLQERAMLPVLGICLGFQSLCMEFGAEVKRLNGPQHGIIRRVTHVGESDVKGRKTIFDGVGRIHATHYQSLHAHVGQDSKFDDLWKSTKFDAPATCPDLLPLAWAEWEGGELNDSGIKDNKILVGVQHKTKPFWALQYHPESICTNAESRKVIFNWFQTAQDWNRTKREQPINLETPLHGGLSIRESLLHRCERIFSLGISSENKDTTAKLLETDLGNSYKCRIITLPDYMSVPDIVESIQDLRQSQIILDSSNANERLDGSADVRGRYSIVGLDIDDCWRFEHTAGESTIRIFGPDRDFASPYPADLRPFGRVWSFLASFLEKRRIQDGHKDSPFWGGFMGYTTYEMGLESINVKSTARKEMVHKRPDLCFAWITRSLVFDHVKGLMYLQELSFDSFGGSSLWMDNMALKLEAISQPQPIHLTKSVVSLFDQKYDEPISANASSSDLPASTLTESTMHSRSIKSRTQETSISSCPSPGSISLISQSSSPLLEKPFSEPSIIITAPSNSEYESKVRLCQDYIRAGDSYELCLTDQTTVQRHLARNVPDHFNHPSGPFSSWSLYRRLRARQPAPFASYITLGGSTLISSSPERFLTWSSSGEFELRPMKGTVRKTPEVCTLAQAKKLLDVPKEKAENLMIVDLVRHDLHGVCGAGNVQVPRLMVVEEYKSVFQMISIVKGNLVPPLSVSSESKGRNNYSGIDVLAASLPPGSMTGAPKKRSCEILQEIEGKERGLYSGVVGYMDIGGRGDWSVTIRSMFGWDDELVRDEDGGVKTEIWHVGAGGAVTILSTDVGEREEMQTKLNGTLGVFR